MPAPKGNQNNKKPADEVKSAWLKMRLNPQTKSKWVREAHKLGMTLSAYVEYKVNGS